MNNLLEDIINRLKISLKVFETTMDSADVIIIPGGSHPQLMESAAELFHQGFAPYIFPSGGSTPSVKTTEWEFLRSIGIKLGVPDSAILREDKATNTFENFCPLYTELG